MLILVPLRSENKIFEVRRLPKSRKNEEKTMTKTTSEKEHEKYEKRSILGLQKWTKVVKTTVQKPTRKQHLKKRARKKGGGKTSGGALCGGSAAWGRPGKGGGI